MITLDQIIEGCKKEQSMHQEALFNKYSKVLYGICLRYIQDKDDAKDVLQESFIKIFYNINEYRGEGSFEGWIKRITANTALYFLKKKKKLAFVYDVIDDLKEDIYEEDKLDPNIDTEFIMACITKLPDGYRIILCMYLLEGFSHAEIAQKLGIKEATSRSQYFKARKSLLTMISIKKTEPA